MSSDSDVKIRIGAQNDASSAINSAGKDMEDLGKRAEKTGKGFGLLTGAIAGIGIVGVTGEMKKWVAEAEEAERVGAQLEAVIKSTGGVAGLTADEVRKMADSLSAVTTLDNDVILAGQNMLLTFTNIGEEAMPLATQAMVDMATAMNGGATPSAEQLSNTAIMLGKALNDPINGMSALTRVGVTFTDQQKEMMEGALSNADTFGQQKVILDELAKEFGGSATAAAQTYTGQLEMLSKSVNNLRETMGTHLLGAINSVIGATVSIVGFLKEHEAIAIGLGAALATILVPALIGLGVAIWTSVIPAIAAMTIAAAPWLLAGAVIGGIVAGIVWVVKNWDTMGQKASAVFSAIGNAFKALFDMLPGWAQFGLTTVFGIWKAEWDLISGAFVAVADYIKGHWEGIINFIVEKIEWVTGKITAAIDAVKNLGAKIGGGVSSAGNSIGSMYTKAKSSLHFATGGSFMVGGAGGTDSQLVSFLATPGERVSVQTPGQQAGGGLTINLNIAGHVLTERNLVDFISEALAKRLALRTA